MPYHSIDEILRRCRDRACPFWQVVLTTQAKETQLPESAVLDQMDQMAKAMEDSITQYDPTAVTTGKMGGQNGARLAEYNQKGDTLLGDYLSAVIAAAVQVAESNACMKRIVAAPTAGSCGVIPAVLITYQKQQGLPRRELLRALLVSAGIGSVIAENASISGAQGAARQRSALQPPWPPVVWYIWQGATTTPLPGRRYGAEKYAGTGVRPGSRAGRDPLPLSATPPVPPMRWWPPKWALAGIQSVIPPDEIIDAMYEIGCQLPPACARPHRPDWPPPPPGKKLPKSWGKISSKLQRKAKPPAAQSSGRPFFIPRATQPSATSMAIIKAKPAAAPMVPV